MKKLIAMLAVAFTAIIVGSTSAEAKVVDVYIKCAGSYYQLNKKGADLSFGKKGIVGRFDTDTMTFVKSFDKHEAPLNSKCDIECFTPASQKVIKAAHEASISPEDKKRMKNFKNLKITIKRSKVGTKPQVTVIDKKTGKKVTDGVYYSDRECNNAGYHEIDVAVDSDKYKGERYVKWVVYDDLKNDKDVKEMVEDGVRIFPYTGTAVYPMGGSKAKDVKVCFQRKVGKKWKKVSKAVKPGTYRCYYEGVGGMYKEGSKSKKKVFEIQTWKQIDKMKKYNFKSKPGTKKFEKEFLKRWNKVKTIAPFSDGWGAGALEGTYPTYKYTKKSRMLWYAWDCNSYAMGVCELIFGKRYNDENVKESKQIKDIGVGSCMVVKHGTHIEIVLGIKKNGLLLTAEGNLSGHVNIDDTVAKAKGWQNPTTVKDMYRTFYAWK